MREKNGAKTKMDSTKGSKPAVIMPSVLLKAPVISKEQQIREEIKKKDIKVKKNLERMKTQKQQELGERQKLVKKNL